VEDEDPNLEHSRGTTSVKSYRGIPWLQFGGNTDPCSSILFTSTKQAISKIC